MALSVKGSLAQRFQFPNSYWWFGVFGLIIGIVFATLVTRYFSSSTAVAVDPRSTEVSPRSSANKTANDNPTKEDTSKSSQDFATIVIPQDQWEAIGIRVAPALSMKTQQAVRVTGRVSLNQDRVAHIYPMVTGAVEQVLVTLGQQVKKNELLAIINSREVGDAKLELYQAKLQYDIALVKYRLQEEVSSNALELLVELRAAKDINSIERQFRNRTMGDYRERLLAAYSSYVKSQADVDRLNTITESGAVSGSQLLTATANRNADLATFQSRIEQIDYEMKTSLLVASHSVKDAETRVAVAATNLKILGCSEEEIASADPSKQGESIAFYSIRAPFDGSLITKDVVLREQVRPDVMVFGVADLSTVWITADIYEKHIPLLNQLGNQSIQVRSDAYPDRQFKATTFYTGDVMDESKRTIGLTAVAENQDRLLKPGMFVSIELPEASPTDTTQIPITAVQEHGGKPFVFVMEGNGVFRQRPIAVGQTNNDVVSVANGLQPGEMIATEGGFILKSKMLAELMGE